MRLGIFSLVVILLLLLPSAFAFFSFFSFPPPPPPIFRLSDVNGEDLNVQDILARNIDANSITLNYLVARNEIDFNILHNVNAVGFVESRSGFVSDLFCSFSDRENCIDASGPIWNFDNFGIVVDGDITGFDITANNDLDVLNDLDVADDADIHGSLVVDETVTATGGFVASDDSNFTNIGASGGVFASNLYSGNSVFTAFLQDNFGNGLLDMSGDPWALGTAGFEISNGNFNVATGDSNFIDVGIAGQTFALDFVNLHSDPVSHLQAATKGYVDIAVSGLDFEFFLTDNASDIGGYFDLVDTENGKVESSHTSAALNAGLDQEIFNFVTEAGKPEFNTILSSVYDLHAHFQKSGGASKTVTVYWKLWERDSGETETELFSSEESSSVTTIKTAFDIHAVLSEDENIDANRLVVKVYANVVGGGGTVQVIIFQEGITASHISLKPPNTALSELFLSRNGRNWMNADLNLGGNTLQNGDVNAIGDSNFVNIGFSSFIYGDGSKLTGIVSDFNVSDFNIDVDGGFANSVYLAGQKIDGGGA